MPATAAQVFGPITVDPGFTTTGEKILLTMSTTLPAGGINVIIAVVLPNGASSTGAQGYYAIKKGTTVLGRTYVTANLNTGGQTAKPIMLLAVDTAPSGNDSYTFVVNITTAGSTTFSIHVQGMVVKTDDAAIASNSTYVQVNAGATATIVSLNTSYAVNSKVAVLALVYYYSLSSGAYFISGGNIRVKLDTSIISTNELRVAFGVQEWTGFTNLCALATPTSGSQTWRVEIYNDSSVNIAAFAILVTFTVSDGAFLDTASVALVNGSQVTVGNLTTSLVGDVAVIGIATADNTNTTNVNAFNAGDVVLQRDGSATGQISNLVLWWLESTNLGGRLGMLPLLRVDTGVSNPSYQIKMTARASGINGEAKILAFSLVVVQYVNVSDTISFTEAVSTAVQTFATDTVSLSDEARSDAEISVSDTITFTEEITSPRQVYATDSVSFTESIGPNEISVSDAVSFTEAVGIEAHIGVSDSISFTEAASRTEPITAVSDTITFSEVVSIQRNIQRLEAAKRLITAKRVISDQRESGVKRSSI